MKFEDKYFIKFKFTEEQIKRNLDFYAGGIEVSEKECKEYIHFVGEIVSKVKKAILVPPAS